MLEKNIRRYNLELLQAVAESYGGKCLAIAFSRKRERVEWECAEGHRWLAMPITVVDGGRWCAQCGFVPDDDIRLGQIREIAEAKQGRCLSTRYVSYKGLMQFQCSAGHYFEKSSSGIVAGKWCPFCAVETRRGLRERTLKNLKQIVNSKGGSILDVTSSALAGDVEINVRCEFGHEWRTKPKSVIAGKWCHSCAGNRKIQISEAKELASGRYGECLSSDIGSSTKEKLKWRCKFGHEWRATFNSVKSKGSWCPECSTGFSERFCRVLFEAYFGQAFPKEYPEWLKSREGNQLELDGYCQALKLAFEHHGEQHYKKTSFFVNDEAEFLRQQHLDSLKIALCKENGVRLIEISQLPSRGNHQELKLHVYEALVRQGLPIEINIWMKIDTSPAYLGEQSQKRLELLHDLVRKKGGTTEAQHYENLNQEISLRCSEGHRWTARIASIFSGYWCRECSVKNRKLDAEKIQQRIQLLGGSLIGFEKINGRKNAPKIQCRNGHTFIATNWKRSWCPHCDKRGSRLSIKDLRETAESKGGACLSDEYMGISAKYLWRCSSSHQWEATAGSVRNGSWCPQCHKLARPTISHDKVLSVLASVQHMRSEGKTVQQIADKLDLSLTAYYRFIRKYSKKSGA